MSRKEEIAAALELGRDAFRAGTRCAPVNDARCMEMCAGKEFGKSGHIYKAWARGWMIENLGGTP